MSKAGSKAGQPPLLTAFWRFSAAAAAFSLVSAAALACIWRPNALAALTLVPAWCWLVTGLISAVVLCRTGRRRWAGAIALLWLAFAIGWVEELRSLARVVRDGVHRIDASAGRSLRIVTLNCDHNERCVADLKLADADVVLLQESPGADRLAEMVNQLYGGEGSFLVSGDLAILARGRLQAELSQTDSHFLVGDLALADGFQLRCVSLRLIPPVSRLDVWSPGFWSDHRAARETRRRQLREVVEKVGEKAVLSPLIVGGDFNSPPLDRAFDELRTVLADSFSTSGRGWGATGTNDWPLFRVDQVWTNARLAPTRVVACRQQHSDHRMVVCDVVATH